MGIAPPAKKETAMRRRWSATAVLLSAFLVLAACGTKAPGPPAGPLHILISNDDGIEDDGLEALFEALLPLGRVTVAAPHIDRSGTSHGVTSDRPIGVTGTIRDGMSWFAIDALPATCVRLAIEKFLPEKPDLVVSGINPGENLGTVTFYSATVGAAREATFLGVPAMAVNSARGPDRDIRVAALVAARLVAELGTGGLPKGFFLNVNVPPLPADRIKGVRITRQDTRAPLNFFEKTATPEGGTEYKPSWKHLEPAGRETDIWAVRNGYVSVSVLGIDQSAAAVKAAAKSLRRLEKISFE
jgi:5'-nucleotidase